MATAIHGHRDRCHRYVSTLLGIKNATRRNRPAAIDQREHKKRGTINTTVVVILPSFNVVRHPGRLSVSETSFFFLSIPFSVQVRRQEKKKPQQNAKRTVYFFRRSHRVMNERRETMTDVRHIIIIIIIAIIIIIKTYYIVGNKSQSYIILLFYYYIHVKRVYCTWTCPSAVSTTGRFVSGHLYIYIL